MSPRKRKFESPKSLSAKRLQDFFGDKNFYEISHDTGISRGQISNILQGISPPSAKILEYVALHGGDVHYILTGEKREENTKNTPADLGVVTDNQRLVSALIQRLLNILLEIQYRTARDAAEADKCASYLGNILKDVEGLS